MVSVCFPVAAQAVQQALLAMFSVDDDAQFHISDDWNVWLLVAAFDINSEVKQLGFDLQPAETQVWSASCNNNHTRRILHVVNHL